MWLRVSALHSDLHEATRKDTNVLCLYEYKIRIFSLFIQKTGDCCIIVHIILKRDIIFV